MPGEEHKTIHGAEHVLRCARAGRRGARRPRGGRRRRRGRRPRRLLRGGLPARHAPRAGADHARGPGRLRLRREDRRGPARGQELRRRLPPALRGARATRRRSTRSRPRSCGRLRRGGQDRPDRRRRPVGARAPGRRRGRPRDHGLPADEARRRRRGRARRRAPPGAQPRSHRRSRDRGRHRLRALPPWGGRGHRAAGGAAAVRAGTPAQRGGASCSRRAGCRSSSPERRSDERAGAGRPRQEARGRPGAVRADRGPGRCDPGHDVDAAALRAAVEEVHSA